jgi:hypothetical protein
MTPKGVQEPKRLQKPYKGTDSLPEGLGERKETKSHSRKGGKRRLMILKGPRPLRDSGVRDSVEQFSNV